MYPFPRASMVTKFSGLYQSLPNHYKFQHSKTKQKQQPHNHIPIGTWVKHPSVKWISVVQISTRHTCDVRESWWWWCQRTERILRRAIRRGWILWSWRLWWRWRWWRRLLDTWVGTRAWTALYFCICFLRQWSLV